MNVDTQYEELSNLHIDLLSTEVDLARQRNLRGNVLARFDGRSNKLFKERRLCDTVSL